ncbi:hypothetical protein BC828DRAFT_403120 [Blastocladiella britannica]|nr:hypothetical protein BC828DRAFT_403120 [Blastocladiella britannica]
MISLAPSPSTNPVNLASAMEPSFHFSMPARPASHQMFSFDHLAASFHAQQQQQQHYDQQYQQQQEQMDMSYSSSSSSPSPSATTSSTTLDAVAFDALSLQTRNNGQQHPNQHQHHHYPLTPLESPAIHFPAARQVHHHSLASPVDQVMAAPMMSLATLLSSGPGPAALASPLASSPVVEFPTLNFDQIAAMAATLSSPAQPQQQQQQLQEPALVAIKPKSAAPKKSRSLPDAATTPALAPAAGSDESDSAAQDDKPRSRLTREQMASLKRVYASTYFPDKATKERLSRELAIPARTIQIWFQNQRQYHRLKLKKRNALQREQADVAGTHVATSPTGSAGMQHGLPAATSPTGITTIYPGSMPFPPLPAPVSTHMASAPAAVASPTVPSGGGAGAAASAYVPLLPAPTASPMAQYSTYGFVGVAATATARRNSAPPHMLFGQLPDVHASPLVGQLSHHAFSYQSLPVSSSSSAPMYVATTHQQHQQHQQQQYAAMSAPMFTMPPTPPMSSHVHPMSQATWGYPAVSTAAPSPAPRRMSLAAVVHAMPSLTEGEAHHTSSSPAPAPTTAAQSVTGGSFASSPSPMPMSHLSAESGVTVASPVDVLGMPVGIAHHLQHQQQQQFMGRSRSNSNYF